MRFGPQKHIDPHALDPAGGLVPLHRSTAHDWRSPYGRRRKRYPGGRERVGVSQWKTEQPLVQGGERRSPMWFMINGASPITFQLKASLQHRSSALHRRGADRFCTRYAILITMVIYAGPGSHPCTRPRVHTCCLQTYIPKYKPEEKSHCHQNKWQFITVRLREVQRPNAHYYIDAGLTPPYTQRSIKRAGKMEGEQWTRTTGESRERGTRRREIK